MTKKIEQRVKIKIPKSIFINFLFSISAVLFLLLLTACENPLLDLIFQPRHVTFDSNGGSPVKSQNVFKGDKVLRPSDPVKPANEFVGWYLDSDLFYEWSFDTIPESDLTLYAKWDDSGIDVFATEPSIVKIVGYDPLDDDALVVTVSNTSAIANTGELAIELSGDNEDSFTLSTNLINNISPYSTVDFFVTPKTGLSIGVYTVVVTVRGNEEDINDKISKSVTLNFTVVKDVTNIVIVTQPSKLEYTYGQLLDLSGLTINVLYSDGSRDDNLPYSSFASSERFFTAIPESGADISVLEHNGNPVKIFWVNRFLTETDKLIVNPAPIFSAAVSVTPPVSGKIPNLSAYIESGSNFTVDSVTWNTDDPIFIFEKTYRVSVTLTVVNGNYTFSGGLTNAKINGETAAVSNNIGATVTLSYDMEATRANVYGISIKTYPAKIIYTHGETLSLAGLVVSLYYDDSTQIDVAYNSFSNYGESTESITTNLSNGIRLSHSSHNGSSIIVTYSNTSTGVTASDSIYLTVDRKTITITGVTAANRSYNGTTTVNLSGGTLRDIVSPDSVDFERGIGFMENANAGNGKFVNTAINLIGNDAWNYTLTQPSVTVSITPLALSITGVEHTKEYDTTTDFPASNSYYVLLNGILYDDYVYATITNAYYTSVNAGTKTIRITAIYLDGFSANNYSITAPSGNVATFELNTEDNYVNGGGITKASGAYVGVPEFHSIGKNNNGETTIIISSVPALATGQSVEYAISTENTMPSAWINSTIFSTCNGKILSNQTYYVYARSMENINYETGTSNVSYPITLCRVSLNYSRWELPLFSVLVLQGETISNITIPPGMGSFLGWFTTSDVLWNTSDLVTDDITLIAKWLD